MLHKLRQPTRSFQGPMVLGLVAVYTIGLVFSLGAKHIIARPPEVITTQQALAESTLLFTIPVDEVNIHYGPTYNEYVPYYMHGFATGDDGTFWIIDVSSRLLRYSSEGALLREVTLPKVLVTSDPYGPSVLDVKARGMDLWILAFVEPITGSMPSTLFRLSHSGQELARYPIPDDSPIRVGTIVFGEHEQVLIANPTAAPKLLQILDSGGAFDLRQVEGYTRQGKRYSARFDQPGNRYRRSATIQAGDASFGVSVTPRNMFLSGVCVCHVNPDGSFYVFMEQWDRNSIGFMPPEYRTILYYSADGTALAQVPEVLTGDDHPGSWLWQTWSWHERLALRADGSLYILRPMPEEGSNTTHFEVRHLKFVPAVK